MVWIVDVFGSTTHMNDGGVEGYFQFQGIGQNVQTVVNLIPQGGAIPGLEHLVSDLPNRVAFGVINNSGRVVFEGNNLTVGNVTLPNGTILPVLTGGTLTAINYYDNSLMRSVIENGGNINDPALALPQNLNLSVRFTLPNVPAAALSNAVVAAYETASLDPVLAYFSQDQLIFRGSDGPNGIVGGIGNDLMQGNGGLDNIFGGPGNDTLDGGAGSDGLNGGEGSDYYLPGPPDPSGIIGDSASDSGVGNPGDIDIVSYANAPGPVVIDLNSLDGDQSFGWARGLIASGIEGAEGSIFNDVIHGTDIPQSIQDTANDTLLGNAGDDTLIGYQGSDFLQGGPGFDLLIGGPNGDIRGPGPGDVAAFNASSSQIELFTDGQGGLFVYAPGGGIDQLVEIEFLGLTDGTFPISAFSLSSRVPCVGDANNNSITCTDNDDLIFGRDGNDTLNGLDGRDSIDGENGNDQLNGGDGGDTLIGAAGRDTLIGLAGNDRIFGGTEADRLQGNAGSDFMLGEAGADELTGGIGFDTMDGGLGNDLLVAQDGFDRLFGRAGNDTLIGNAGSDMMDGGDGDDSFVSGIGADTVLGGAGNDAAAGNGGGDRLEGGAGNDTLDGNNSGDTLLGDAGNDLLRGGFASDNLAGGSGRDTLQAGNGIDTLTGGGGADRLEGNAGADDLNGGAGNDTLFGGIGADVFRFDQGSGEDLIVDMGIVDSLILDADLLSAASPDFNDLRAHASVNSGNLVLTFGPDVLTINNIASLDLLRGDISFDLG